MTSLRDLSLIPFFDFYLATMFLLSAAQRVRQYLAVLGLVGGFPSRWPRLLGLVRQRRDLFLTGATVAPAALALALWLAHSLASRLVWPEAGRPPHGLTLGRLAERPGAFAVVAAFGLGMLAVDVYFLVVVGRVDRAETEKYFDQAEYWLTSWAAPVVKAVTFGRINPRKMVAAEVEAALVSATRLLNATLWWTVLQAGLRVAFGLSLWGTYALARLAA